MTEPTVRLLLADVDGTLVTQDKVLTDRAVEAVHKLGDAGVLFAITSGRPPKGMAMLTGPLDIQTPIAAFNGGLLVNRDIRWSKSASSPQNWCPEWPTWSGPSLSTSGSTAAPTGTFPTPRAPTWRKRRGR